MSGDRDSSSDEPKQQQPSQNERKRPPESPIDDDLPDDDLPELAASPSAENEAAASPPQRNRRKRDSDTEKKEATPVLPPTPSTSSHSRSDGDQHGIIPLPDQLAVLAAILGGSEADLDAAAAMVISGLMSDHDGDDAARRAREYAGVPIDSISTAAPWFIIGSNIRPVAHSSHENGSDSDPASHFPVHAGSDGNLRHAFEMAMLTTMLTNGHAMGHDHGFMPHMGGINMRSVRSVAVMCDVGIKCALKALAASSGNVDEAIVHIIQHKSEKAEKEKNARWEQELALAIENSKRDVAGPGGFSEKDVDADDKCPVCWEDMWEVSGDETKMAFIPCRHTVCNSCADRISTGNFPCPVCRADISSIEKLTKLKKV